ncbi:hypothetical protein HOP50_01g04320 [Chloropicon primus]|uniref:Uncharacterized protein n=1 Tax=Chloropicon primus TaxID=1764295 RepID=A0A5B8MBS5_9CHLO|nr:hypothetical protein A3770_01p04440 [Chloropicon primus]UPQ97141.1 hypothetical protein HOP50_01g04320 [Chloropicon primus]|eukprot:QDZ17926.1 hypothetical protein A3770_01p04440 [Chloropicon primus]
MASRDVPTVFYEIDSGVQDVPSQIGSMSSRISRSRPSYSAAKQADISIPLLKATHLPLRPTKICEENFDRKYQEECAFWEAKRQAHMKLSEKFTAHHMNNDRSVGIDDNGKLYLGGKAKVRPASEGIWDPILHEWRLPPSEEEFQERLSRPKTTGGTLDISGNVIMSEVEKQHIKRVPYPPHIGKYNPITNKWIIAPRDSNFHDREKTSLPQRKRRVDLPQVHDGYYHPLRHEWISARPGTAPPASLTAGTDLIASDGGTAKIIGKLKSDDQERKYGKYDPIKNDWVEDPSSPSLKANDYLTQKGKKRVAFPGRVGKYDPIKMEWVIPPREVAVPARRGKFYN